MQSVRPIMQIGEQAFATNPTVETLFVKGYEELILRQKKSNTCLL